MGRKVSLDDVDKSIAGATLQYADAATRLDTFFSDVMLGTKGKAPRDHYWDADADQQYVGQTLWRATAMLTMANSFWTSLSRSHPRKVDESTARVMKSFSERSNALYDEAVETQAKLDFGGRLGLPRIDDLDLIVPDGEADEQIEPLWNALLALADLVQIDLGTRILKYSLPFRFRVAKQAFEATFQPELAVIEADKQRLLMVPSSDTMARRGLVTAAINKHAADLWHLGQLIWAPALMDSVFPGRPYAAHLNDKPGFNELQQELGFNLWCLTDPAKAKVMQSSREAEAKLVKLWEENPDPRATFQLAVELNEQLKAGRIRNRTGQAYNYCPWAGQFLVHDPVMLGGKQFVPGELVVLYVGKDADGKFVAEIRKSGRLTSAFDLLGARRK